MYPLYFYKYLLCMFLIIFYFMYKETNMKTISFSSSDPLLSSSVFCTFNKNNSKTCIFRNLCYNFYTKFMFVLTEKSIISGLNSKNNLKNIFATSVLNHSALPLKISVIYGKNLSDIFIYEKDIFLLHRFKPDNIMHVIHDDILPLYVTYRDLCLGNISNCVLKYDIAFSDENIEGNFIEWYQAFSKTEPFQLSKLNRSITYCFSKINVGLSIESVFFQYGFLQNRGSTELSIFQAQLLKQFRKFILDYFEVNNNFKLKFHVVFMGRKLNRKILNEDYVENIILNTIKKELNTSVSLFNMDLSINSTKEILHYISKSNYLIGMHGAGMFLALFLPENSVAIEMFPYGINKELVSPLYVMSLIPGIWLSYFSWENYQHLNSFPHPEYPSILGGLNHLIRKEQINIFNKSLNSPSKICCNDPLFLSRMYQDTIIDDTFIETINFALKSQSEYRNTNLDQTCMYEWFFPAVVQNVTCFKNISDFHLSWKRPFNIDLYTNVTYNIAVQTYNKNLSVITSNCSLILNLDSEISNIKVWIRCNMDGVKGLDTFITC